MRGIGTHDSLDPMTTTSRSYSPSPCVRCRSEKPIVDGETVDELYVSSARLTLKGQRFDADVRPPNGINGRICQTCLPDVRRVLGDLGAALAHSAVSKNHPSPCVRCRSQEQLTDGKTVDELCVYSARTTLRYPRLDADVRPPGGFDGRICQTCLPDVRRVLSETVKLR